MKFCKHAGTSVKKLESSESKLCFGEERNGEWWSGVGGQVRVGL